MALCLQTCLRKNRLGKGVAGGDLPRFPEKQSREAIMKKNLFRFFLSLLFLAAFSAPSLADTSVFVDFDGRPRRSFHHPRHHSFHHARRPLRAPVFFYPAPTRTIVYGTTTILRPAPSPLEASAVSPDYVSATTGQLCREYQTTGWVAGSQSVIYGTACLQSDGSWRVVD